MNRRSRRSIEKAKNAARSELTRFGWDTLRLDVRMPLIVDDVPDNIERINGAKVTHDAFVDRFEAPNRPVIVTNLTRGWQANEKWTVERLTKKYRNQKFKCGEDDDGHSVKLKMKYFTTYMEHNRDDSPLYIFDSSFADRRKVKRLAEDYTVPPYFVDDLFNYTDYGRRPPHRWFVMGPARSGTGIHIDPLGTSAWNTLVKGHKRWVLIPPGASKELVKPTKAEGGKHTSEGITWFAVQYPKTKLASWPKEFAPIECVQRPGETMFVPGGWWHVVLNMDTTIAVTQNFCSPTNLPSVWCKTVKGRPKLSKQMYRRLKKSRPSLAKIIDGISPARIRDTEVSSSSSDSSSSSSDNTSDSEVEDDETKKRPSSRDSGNGDGGGTGTRDGVSARKRPADDRAGDTCKRT